MNPRSVLFFIGLFGLLFACTWIALHNGDLMQQPLTLGTWVGRTAPITIPVGQALLLAFLLGVTAVAVMWTSRAVDAMAATFAGRQQARVQRQVEATYQHGLEALVNGQPDQALSLMAQVLVKDGEHARALMTGADVLRSMGRALEAVEWRKRRLVTAPEDFSALHGLAEDHRAAGQLESAADILERVIRLRPKRAVAAAEALREVYLEMGRHEAASEAHDRLLRMETAPPLDKAEAELVRTGIETRWARELLAHGELKDARSLLLKVIKRHPHYVPGHLALFDALVASDREDEGITVLVECFERTNDACILVHAERHFLARRHEGDEIERAAVTLSALKRFAACSGSRPVARAFLGKAYTRYEMLDDAARVFETLREEHPDNAVVNYFSARIAEKQGRATVAAQRYRALLRELEVLDVRYRCEKCQGPSPDFRDRCPHCRRWGTLAVDLGVAPLRGPAPSPRPVFSVPDDDETVVEQDAMA